MILNLQILYNLSSIAGDGVRPALDGVYCVIKDGILRMASSNGIMAGIYSEPTDQKDQEGVTISIEAIKKCKIYIGISTDITIVGSDIFVGNAIIKNVLVSHIFPNFEMIIPKGKPTGHAQLINVQHLTNILKLIRKFRNSKICNVEMLSYGEHQPIVIKDPDYTQLITIIAPVCRTHY